MPSQRACFRPALSSLLDRRSWAVCTSIRHMQDMQARLEKYRSDAAECALISNLATNREKKELFARLAEHLTVLASEVERAIAKGDGT